MLADLIQAQIQANKWKSRDPVVRRSGLSAALIGKLVRGELANITIHTADRLATALNVPVEKVMAAALTDVRAAQEDVASTGDAA
jgi:transcriptional regulator with XRE-family HTH domain